MSARNDTHDAPRFAILGGPTIQVLRCSNTDCERPMLPNEDFEGWQDLRERCGLLICPDCEHVCENCCGDGYNVEGDRDYPCLSCWTEPEIDPDDPALPF